LYLELSRMHCHVACTTTHQHTSLPTVEIVWLNRRQICWAIEQGCKPDCRRWGTVSSMSTNPATRAVLWDHWVVASRLYRRHVHHLCSCDPQNGAPQPPPTTTANFQPHVQERSFPLAGNMVFL
jgi:hypothetical protein